MIFHEVLEGVRGGECGEPARFGILLLEETQGTSVEERLKEAVGGAQEVYRKNEERYVGCVVHCGGGGEGVGGGKIGGEFEGDVEGEQG